LNRAPCSEALDGDAEIRDEALLGLLETAVRSKHFPEAEQLLKQIDAEYPGRVDQSALGEVRDQLAEWRRRREAAKVALAALEAKSEEAAAPVEAADEESVAEEIIEEAVTADPVAPPPETPPVEAASVEVPAQPREEDHLLWARQLREEGNFDGAIKRYKKALVQNDNQPMVWAELSELYLATGQDSWAQATANEALRREPENPKLVLQFLRAAQRTMRPEQVIAEMENAYRKAPDQPEIVLVLARAYADQNNLRNASLLYRKFLEMVPADHPERLEVELELQELGN
jgi:tetratricopeptide (TPR) repeat protein